MASPRHARTPFFQMSLVRLIIIRQNDFVPGRAARNFHMSALQYPQHEQGLFIHVSKLGNRIPPQFGIQTSS